jgi:hypothetical protein
VQVEQSATQLAHERTQSQQMTSLLDAAASATETLQANHATLQAEVRPVVA